MVYAALGGGMLIVSSAAILIRIAQAEGTSSLAIAALRLGVASLILMPIAWWKAAQEFKSLRPRDLALATFSGACLALHFASWITSLEYTSVASSTALVTTNPIWVGIASLFLLRERLTTSVCIGIAFALVGTIAMFMAQSGSFEAAQGNPLLGNTLALIGALSASAYLIVGRILRTQISLVGYISIVYSVAAVILLGATLLRGEALMGMSSVAYACILGLALGPQLLGHTILNWSVRHVSATLVALSILGEPIGSSLLALAIFDETIGWVQGLGFVLILLGIFFAVRGSART